MSSSVSSSDQQARRFSAATEALVKASINVVKVEQSLEEMKAMKVTASSIDSNTASILDRVGNLEKETKELKAIVTDMNAGLTRQGADISGLLRLQRVNHVIAQLEQGKFVLTVWFKGASSKNCSKVYYRDRKSNPSSVNNHGPLTVYLAKILTHAITGCEWNIGGRSFESEDSSDDEDTIMKKEKTFRDSFLNFIRNATGIEPELKHEDDKYTLSLKIV